MYSEQPKKQYGWWAVTGIEVVTGTLEISSTAADAPVTVSAGQCLLGRADTDPRLDESHIILQLLEAATCP